MINLDKSRCEHQDKNDATKQNAVILLEMIVEKLEQGDVASHVHKARMLEDKVGRRRVAVPPSARILIRPCVHNLDNNYHLYH